MRALDSIRAQSYRPLEVLVVDDGSSDDTSKLVEEWRQANVSTALSLHYVWKENSGPSACRNIGIRKATGAYVYFLDSDDYMHGNLLSESIQIMENEDADCILFGFDFQGPDGVSGQWLPPNQPALISFFENSLWGYTSSSVKSMELIQRSGFWNEKICVAEDYEFLGRVLFNSKKNIVLQRSFLTVSRGEDSLGRGKDFKEGILHRLVGEASIMEEVLKRRAQIPEEFLALYSDRLVKTAINMYASGEGDFARDLRFLESKLNIRPRSSLAAMKRFVLSHGRWACWLWYSLYRIHTIRNKRSSLADI